MKANDWIAINLNIQNTKLTPDDLRVYNINPDNTGIMDKSYYESIPQVKEAFKKNDGSFDSEAFGAFYDSAKRAYTDFATNDYVDRLIQSVPTSANDIFSLGNTNIADDTVRIVRTRDPQRHAVGIGNIFEAGDPSFSEREVAQSNKVIDENGKQLNWTPEDKGGLFKALFRPTLALAVWENDGTHIENGIEVQHHKGEHKYDEFGDPMYQVLGKNEIYGREILRYSDTLSKEGSIWNKIDIFDNDGVKSNPAKTIARTVARIVPYLTPYGYVFGAIDASIALGQTLPVLTKAINGFVTGDNDNGIGQKATSVENFMSRFGTNQSDEGQGRFWSIENLGQMIADSASQLYSQRLIQKMPKLIAKWRGVEPSAKAMKLGQNLSLAYMATTSAEDVYGAYKQAGVNDRMAGVGALATMGAFYWLMNHEYFKEMLFRDPGMELPELKQVLYKEAGLTGKAIAQRQLENEGIKLTAGNTAAEAAKWYQRAFSTSKSFMKEVLPKIKNIGSPFSTNVYLSRAFNEGVEETMEEGISDFIKGLSLGLQQLGFNIKDKDAAEVDFGFSPEDFLSRYTSSFIGGAIGGAVFEGLTQWDNRVLHRNIRRISDLEDSDLQLTWYIRNGYGKELMNIIDAWEKKGRFGSKNLSWSYKIDTDPEGNKKLVYNSGTISDNQNTAVANLLRQRIKYKAAQLESLNLMLSDSEILDKAVAKIEEEANSQGYTDLDKFRNEKLRDERVDFIRSVGVDRIIISDVADLQKQQTKLIEMIEDREADLLNVQDTQANSARETVDNDETLKRWRKDLNESKKKLDDLLSGKNADEYLALGLFLGDDILKQLYISDLGAETNPTYFEESVSNFVRAKYGENYNEIINREGKATQDYFESEYQSWLDASDSKQRLRHAFTIHQALSQQLLPIIEEQIKNYSEYKTDPERSNVITATEGAVNWEEYERQLEEAETALQTAISTPGTGSQEIETLTKQVAQLQAIVDLKNDPKRVLEVLFKETETSEPNSLEKLGELQDNKTILQFLKNYYTRLNNEKIVSEFSDDLINRGLKGVSQNIRSKVFGETYEDVHSPGILDELFLSTSADANDLGENFLLTFAKYLNDPSLQNVNITIQDSNGNDIDVNLHDALNELNNLYNQGNVIITYNGKTQHILDHIADLAYEAELDEIVDEFSEFGADRDIKKNSNSAILDQEKFALLKSKFNDVLIAIENDPDNAEVVYRNLISYVAESIKAGELNLAKISDNAEKDAESYVNSILFPDGINVINEIAELKQLRANMIHTPIMDWIDALSVQLNGFPTHLWQMLKDEQKRLYGKQRLDDYTIKDPFVLNELQFLQSALIAAKAIHRGMLPLGVNMYINRLRAGDKKEQLPVLDNFVLSDVYSSDLNIILERVNYLLDLHERNKQSTVKQKKQSMIVGAPKIIKAIIGKTSTELDEKDPAIFIWDKLKELSNDKNLPLDVKQLWVDSGNVDLDTVTEENFDAFWTNMRNFMNALHDEIQKFITTDGTNRLDKIADVLISGFTDLWKLKNSTISHKQSSKIEDLDVLYWLASVIAVDPRTTYGLIKTVESTSGVQPFWDQLLNIQLGFARMESPDFFNILIDKIAKTVSNSTEMNDDSKGYMEAKSIIKNAIFIDGAAGTGKSSVVLRYLREMRKLQHPNIGAIAVSQYENRTDALKQHLKVSDEDTFTKSKLISILLGRDLTNDDFTSNEGHERILKDSVYQEIDSRADIWKSLLNDRDGLDIYVDESGFLSEAEFQFFSKVSELANVQFIFAGDKMQNGTVIEMKNPKTGEVKWNNSGTFDIVGVTGPRLNLSMRAGNLGMINNLNRVEIMVQKMLDVYVDKPWLKPDEIWNQVSAEMSPFEFEYFETPNSLYGIAQTSDSTSALEKLKQFPKTKNKGPKIVIITDNVDNYSANRSDDIEVLDVGAVQGGEYDYYLIDVKNIAKFGNFDYLRNVYTIISRARIGGYVVGNLGNLFPGSKSNNTASIIVNPKAEGGEDTDSAMENYKKFFNHLLEPETWDSTTVISKPKFIPPPPQSVSGTEPQVNPKFSRINTGNNPYDGWKGVEEWKTSVKANGSKASNLLFGDNQKTKRADFDNYKLYNELINQHENDGTLIDTKSFIDWLFSNSSDDIVFGENANITKPIGKLTLEQQTEFKKLIRNLSLDLIVLDKDTRRKKYSDGIKARNAWYNLSQNNTKWVEQVDKLFNAVAAMDDLELYAITDNDFCYLYFTFDNVAIPVARIKGAYHQGYITISTTRQTPMIILSTDGNMSQLITDTVGNYVELGDKAFIVKVNEDEIDTTNEDVTRFIRQNKGKPLGYLSDTFNDDDEIQLLQPKINNKKIERLDKTGDTDGHRRLNAISKRIDLVTYVHLANLLYKAQHQGVTESELNELKLYFSSDVTNIIANDNIEEIIKYLRKFSLLGQENRSQLTSALMRYFWNNRESDPNAWLQFRENIIANGGWVTSDTWLSKDKTKLRQKGLSFTIYGDTGTSEVYNILFDKDSGNYQVRVQAIQNGSIVDAEIGQLDSKQWADAQNIDPIQMAKTILTLAKEKVWDVEKAGGNPIEGQIIHAAMFNESNPLAKFANGDELDDNAINDLFVNGKISIGLTTRQESLSTNGSGKVSYFAPFDSDVASLLNDTNYNPTQLNKFLSEDAIFKYGFIVSVSGKNYDGNDNFLQAETTGLITDACEILPPLYTINFKGSGKTGSSFGSINHKIETSDPTENTVTFYRDSSGNINQYILEKNFIVSRENLSDYISNLPDSSTFVITKATPKSITIKAADNSEITYNTIKDPVSLFEKMKVIDSNDRIIARSENNEYSLTRDENKRLVIEYNGLTDKIDTLYVDEETIALLFNNTIVKFNGLSSDIVNEIMSQFSLKNGKYIGNINTEFGVKIIYQLGQQLFTREVGELLDNTGFVGYQIVSIDPINKIVNLSKNGIIIQEQLDDNSFVKLMNNNIPVQTSNLNPKTVAKSQLNNIKNLDFEGIDEDANKWAYSNAAKLGGIYKWNGKDAFVKENSAESQMLMVFANWKSKQTKINLQDIIDSINNVEIVDGRNTNRIIVNIDIDGLVQQFEIHRTSKRTKWIVTELVKQSDNAVYENILVELSASNLSPESTMNLIAYMKTYFFEDEESGQIMSSPQFETWLESLTPNSEEYQWMQRITDAYNEIDNNRICNI